MDASVPVSSPARWLTLAARIIVGVLFLKVGFGWFGDHQGLAAILNAYHLLPDSALAPLSRIIPLLLILVGALMLLGLFTRVAAVLSSFTLAIFCVALIEANLRHLPIDCGCSLRPRADTLITWPGIVMALGLLAVAAYAAWRPEGPWSLDAVIFPASQDDEDDEDEEEA